MAIVSAVAAVRGGSARALASESLTTVCIANCRVKEKDRIVFVPGSVQQNRQVSHPYITSY
jgi:hypothetical protein